MRLVVLALLALSSAASPFASASTLMIGGSITQSVPDGTGPAVSNPSLNSIADLEAFTLTLDTTDPIAAPGLYTSTGSLVFSVPSALGVESGFSNVIVSVLSDGSSLDFYLLGCLAGFDCATGNSLSASFQIPASGVSTTGIGATGLDQPHPFDLLEDDGTTDIQGTISSYSNTAQVSTTVTPEPSSGSLMMAALLGSAAWASVRSRRTTNLRRSL